MESNVDYIILLLFFFFFPDKMWHDFEEEIKYGNRFFPKSELLDRVKRIRQRATYEIKPGEIFYRARLYDTPSGYWDDDREEMFRIIKKHYPDIADGNALFDLKSPFDQSFFLALLACIQGESTSPFQEEIRNVLSKEKTFWGYNAENSDAPPKGKVPAGRANPKGISYLYLADDVKTALMEVRPNLNQPISVASIVVSKPLMIFDFCRIDSDVQTFDFSDLDNFDYDGFLLGTFSSYFSSPAFSNDESNYFATQYLCEYIKELGFDGIRFRSSLNPDGKNVVLFDTNKDPTTDCKNYEIIGSKVYSIRKLDIDYQLLVPQALPNEPDKNESDSK